jgi:hypothetical protein
MSPSAEGIAAPDVSRRVSLSTVRPRASTKGLRGLQQKLFDPEFAKAMLQQSLRLRADASGCCGDQNETRRREECAGLPTLRRRLRGAQSKRKSSPRLITRGTILLAPLRRGCLEETTVEGTTQSVSAAAAEMTLTLDQLRRARRAIEEEEGLPADVAAQVLVDFADYTRNEGRMTLDQAFGLNGPSGCDPWHVRLARERRDQAIGAIGEALCPTGTISEKADVVRAAVQRYRSTTWLRRDQHRCTGALAPFWEADSPAAAARGAGRSASREAIDHLLFVAFCAADGAIPDSFERLRKILAAVSS